MKKILVTGKNGLLGNAIKNVAGEYDFEFVFVGRDDYDLSDISEIEKLFLDNNFEYVIHTAACVGGIGMNLRNPIGTFYDNLVMTTHLLEKSRLCDVVKFINFSSICAFPAGLEILEESKFQDGIPYEAHEGYAYAKRMSDIQIGLYRKEYNYNYCSIIPVNIFGEYDNYNLENGHVIPSLIHKCYNAKKENKKFQVWGNGEAQREFIYSEDVARIALDLLSLEGQMPRRIIASPSEELSIKEVVSKVCKKFEYSNVEWQEDKPNGQLKRPTDTSLLKQCLSNFKFTQFDEALEKSIDWFSGNYPNVRL